MANTITTPGSRRLDDVRSLRLRVRRINLSGNYATGGEVIQASALGLKRVFEVVPLSALVRAAAGVTGVVPVIDIASDFRSFTLRSIEDAAGAAGTPLGQEKTNAEAYIASSFLDVLVIGEG